MNKDKPLAWLFFGTDDFAVTVLAELKRGDILPSLIITTPDKARGRKLFLTPPPVKSWAEENKIKYLQPQNLESDLKDAPRSDLYLVASYGKIIPKSILDLPKFGALNIHPSLLPKYRGPSPIQTAILNGDRETGVTIMLLDEEVDHGPVLASIRCQVPGNSFPELRDKLAVMGANLLTEIIPRWLAGEITPQPQDHAQATYTKKISKEDGEIKLADDPELNYRKFLAYQPWPGIYFFQNGQRIKVTAATLDNGNFAIKKVIPEDKKEMTWEDYQRGLRF